MLLINILDRELEDGGTVSSGHPFTPMHEDSRTTADDGQHRADTGSLKGDLQLLLAALADQLSSANWSSVYPSIIHAAERDPELREMQAALHRGFMEPFSVVIERARTRGDVAPGCETSDVVGMAIGSLFFRRWFSRDEITAATVTATLEIIMMAVQPA